MQSAVGVLAKLKVCAAPWPMFMVACEVEDDFERSSILEVLDTLEKVTKAGNLTWMKNIIQFVWKQDDLGTYSSVAGKPVEPYLRYGAALSAYAQLPTFACPCAQAGSQEHSTDVESGCRMKGSRT